MTSSTLQFRAHIAAFNSGTQGPAARFGSFEHEQLVRGVFCAPLESAFLSIGAVFWIFADLFLESRSRRCFVSLWNYHFQSFIVWLMRVAVLLRVLGSLKADFMKVPWKHEVILPMKIGRDCLAKVHIILSTPGATKRHYSASNHELKNKSYNIPVQIWPGRSYDEPTTRFKPISYRNDVFMRCRKYMVGTISYGISLVFNLLFKLMKSMGFIHP